MVTQTEELPEYYQEHFDESFSFGSERYQPEQIAKATAELERWSRERVDILAPAKSVRITDSGELYLQTSNLKLMKVANRVFTGWEDAEQYSDQMKKDLPDQDFPIGIVDGQNAALGLHRRAKSQLWGRLETPVRYVNKQVKRGLTAVMIDHQRDLLGASDQKFLFRVLDGKVQAVLSSYYRAIDSVAMLSLVLPKITEVGGQILNAKVWGGGFTLTAANPQLMQRLADYFADKPNHHFMNVEDGDPHFATINIHNREYGDGSAGASLGAWRKVCNNGVIVTEQLASIQHKGTDMSTRIIDSSIISPATRLKFADAELSKIGDAVTAAFDPVRFTALMQKLAGATEDTLTQEQAEDACKATIVMAHLPHSLLSPMVAELLMSRDLTRFGLIQATTVLAHKSSDALAHNLEKAGGVLLDDVGGDVYDFGRWMKQGSKAFDRVDETEEEEALV